MNHLLSRIGWSRAELARRLACSEAQASRWRGGLDEPPSAILDWLQAVAHAVEQYPAPEWRKRRRKPSV